MAILNKLGNENIDTRQEINQGIKELCNFLNYDIVSIVSFNHSTKIAYSDNILLKKERSFINANERWLEVLDRHRNHLLNSVIETKKTLCYSYANPTLGTYIPLIKNVEHEIYIPISSHTKNTATKEIIACIYLATFSRNREKKIEDLATPKIQSIIYILSKLCEISYFHYKKSESIFNLIHMMSEITEHQDSLTILHPYFVAHLSKKIAISLGLDEDMIEQVYLASLLHDVGKAYINMNVLTKNSALTTEEYDVLKEHSSYGANIIQSVTNLENIALFIKHHHERYDGTGYPSRLKGTQIPLPSRIISIADSIDAMLSQRAYKPAYNIDFVINELITGSNTQFDPKLVEAVINTFTQHPEDLFNISSDIVVWSTLKISTSKKTYSICGTLTKYYFGYIFKSNKFNFLSCNLLEDLIEAEIYIPCGYNQTIKYPIRFDLLEENQVYIYNLDFLFFRNIS